MPRKKSENRKSHRKVAPKKSAKKKSARKKTTSVGHPAAAPSAQIHQGVESELGSGSEADAEISGDNTEYGGEA